MNSQFGGRSGLGDTQPEQKASSKRAIWLLAGVLLVALAAGGAYFAYAQQPDPEVARLEEKGKELFQPPAAGEEPLTPEVMEQRHEQMQEFREEVEQLEPSQRDQLRTGVGRMMRTYMLAEVERYQSLSDEEKVEFLDEKIDQMESRRAWGEQRRQAEGGEQPGPPGGGPPGGGPPGGPGGPPPGGEGGSPPSPEEHRERFQQFRREFISDTTPEQRAQMGQLMEDMNVRREERGLERMPDFGER